MPAADFSRLVLSPLEIRLADQRDEARAERDSLRKQLSKFQARISKLAEERMIAERETTKHAREAMQLREKLARAESLLGVYKQIAARQRPAFNFSNFSVTDDRAR